MQPEQIQNSGRSAMINYKNGYHLFVSAISNALFLTNQSFQQHYNSKLIIINSHSVYSNGFQKQSNYYWNNRNKTEVFDEIHWQL